MAGAIVPSIDFDSSGDNLEFRAHILFFGAGLKDGSLISITILPSDTALQIKNKLVTAIQTEGTNLGYSVPASNIILPAYQRGT